MALSRAHPSAANEISAKTLALKMPNAVAVEPQEKPRHKQSLEMQEQSARDPESDAFRR